MSDQRAPDSKVGGIARGRGLYRWVVSATAIAGTTMAIWWDLTPAPEGLAPFGGPECIRYPNVLTETESPVVVGWGAHLGVTTLTKNEARFEFEITDLTARYSIEFSAAGVERRGDVDISFNGVHIGYVTPYLKTQRVKLPNRHLKTGIPNEVIFDHVANPPKAEPWAISKLRLVVEPGP